MRKNGGATQDQGLKFVLSLMLIIGSFLYTVYLFFENKAIDINSYYFLRYLISLLIFLIILHVIYIFLEGISIKIQYNEKLKTRLNIFSKFIYLISFLFLVILIVFILLFYIFGEIKNYTGYDVPLSAYLLILFSISYVILIFLIKEFLYGTEEFPEIISLMNKPLLFFIAFIPTLCLIYSPVYILVAITILIIYLCYNIVKKRFNYETFRIDLKNLFYIYTIMCVTIAFVVVPFSLFTFPDSISPHIIDGHFTNNMESVYYKKDIQIPITIQVTGVNNNLSVCLVKENSMRDRLSPPFIH